MPVAGVIEGAGGNSQNDDKGQSKDRAENEEGFYSYEQSGLGKQQGYYIYYEKNVLVGKKEQVRIGEGSIVTIGATTFILHSANEGEEEE